MTTGPLSTRSEALEVLRAHGRTRTYSARQTIYARGDEGDSLALIEKGVVRISLGGADGREVTLALLGPGDVIGEISAIDGRERAADVIAAGRVEVSLVPAHKITELIHENPSVTRFFLDMLCARVRSANAHVESHALNSLAGRLVVYFMNNGSERDDGSLHLPDLPSQSELARLVGVTRESVNRQFRAWREDRLLVADGGGYIVPDPVQLQESVLAD